MFIKVSKNTKSSSATQSLILSWILRDIHNVHCIFINISQTGFFKCMYEALVSIDFNAKLRQRHLQTIILFALKTSLT